jgi:hypothetical protein
MAYLSCFFYTRSLPNLNKYIACQNGYLKMFNLLIAKCSDVNINDNFGGT